MALTPDRRHWAPFWPFADRRLVTRTLLAILTPIAVWFATAAMHGAWAAKEDATAHAADMQQINSKLQRILDAACDKQPRPRVCDSP